MPTADALITGAVLRTLDPARPATETADVAVKDGTIVAVGPDSADWRGPATAVHDLTGATLTPGLVDGHMHPVLGSTSFTGIDLSGCHDVDQLRAALAEAVRTTGRGEWITGFALDHNTFAGQPITNSLIEDVLDGIPAVLVLYDGHSALASEAALRAAGIDGPRDFASRSEIVCDPEGRPSSCSRSLRSRTWRSAGPRSWGCCRRWPPPG